MAARPQVGNSQASKICEICTRNTAGYFCQCSGAKIFFCSACFPIHSEKYPNFEHHLVRADIEATDIAACTARAQALAAGRIELQQNLDTIDQCCHDLAAMVGSMVRMLNDYLRDQIAALQAMKITLAADIDEAVREVESTVTVQEVHLQGKYSTFLRYYTPGSLVLFRYRLDPNFVDSCRLSLPIFTLNKPYGKDQSCEALLVRLKIDQVEAFDFNTETWGRAIRLSRSIHFSMDSMYTGVGKDRVFCCEETLNFFRGSSSKCYNTQV